MGEEYGTCGHLLSDEKPVYVKIYSGPTYGISYCILCKKCLADYEKANDLFSSQEEAMAWLIENKNA